MLQVGSGLETGLKKDSQRSLAVTISRKDLLKTCSKPAQNRRCPAGSAGWIGLLSAPGYSSNSSSLWAANSPTPVPG